MKKVLLLVLVGFSIQAAFAQQDSAFTQVTKFYDVNINRIGTEYSREYATLKTNDDKALLTFQYKQVMKQVDSMRNQAYIIALIQTKNSEQIAKLNKSLPAVVYNTGARGLKPATFPGGSKNLRKQLTHLIDFRDLNRNATLFSSQLSMVIEEDGSVSNVNATGTNLSFNRELEIATYLLPQKFAPAKFKGKAVRSEFGFPYTVQLD